MAVKILPCGLDTPQAVARFRDERQMLSTLAHPGIVRLLDGGTTDDGAPYLVMEPVEGVTRHRSSEIGRPRDGEPSVAIAARSRAGWWEECEGCVGGVFKVSRPGPLATFPRGLEIPRGTTYNTKQGEDVSRYSVLLEPIKEPGFEGYYSAHVPALDLTTHGEGVEGALSAARELVEVWLAEKRARGETVPAEPESLLTHIEVSDAVHGP